MPGKWKNPLGVWAMDICKSKSITNTIVAKSVVKLAICLSSPPDDLSTADFISKQLLKATGLEKDDSSESSDICPVVNKSTSKVITSCILQLVEAVITEMDWAIKKLKMLSIVSQKSIYINQTGEHSSAVTFEENLYSRAVAVVIVLSSFVSMSLKGK